MSLLDKLTGRLTAPRLTRRRIVLAVLVALTADALQIPFQLMQPVPEIIDVIAAVLTFGLLGFHLLLLPTFVVEFIPVADMLPTWTACVVAVIALRKREQRQEPLPPLNTALPLRSPPSSMPLLPPPAIPPTRD